MNFFITIKREGLSILLLMLLGIGCVAAPETRMPGPQGIASQAPSPAQSLTGDINQGIAAAAAQNFQSTGDYRVGPEDLLEITLFNIPMSDFRNNPGAAAGGLTPRTLIVRVSQEGKVSLPLLGDVTVKGLTVSGLERLLRQKYDTYIHNPEVGILIKEFRQRVSVIGAVSKPGVFELTGPKTVIDILAMAGGVTEKAGSQVHIYREGPEGRESHVIDLAVLVNSTGLINASNAPMINMPVKPGDLINVPVAGMFFVDGAVHRPGSYPLGRQYSLSQALATAGGVNVELNSNDVTIFRRKGPGDMDAIAFNLNDVMDGTTPDPQIQPDDVIVVPTSTAKYVVRRFIGNLLGGISMGQIGSMIAR